MSTRTTIKEIGINRLANQLLQIRGNMSQETMAEKCDISLRHYSNLERRITAASSITMLHLYEVGVDLNRWAEETLLEYKKINEEQPENACTE